MQSIVQSEVKSARFGWREVCVACIICVPLAVAAGYNLGRSQSFDERPAALLPPPGVAPMRMAVPAPEPIPAPMPRIEDVATPSRANDALSPERSLRFPAEIPGIG